MIKVRTTKEQQADAVLFINSTFDQYKEIMSPYQDRMLDIFSELSSFNEAKLKDWSTSFKVNKAHEISNKITPRMISRNPKWIVSMKPEFVWQEILQNKDIKKYDEATLAIQDLLSNVFKQWNLDEILRIWAKWMVNYWHSFAKVKRKYEIWRQTKKVDEEKIYIDEEWNEQVEKIDKKIEEYVTWEYSTIDVSSRADLYYDLRYKTFDEMPAIIEVTSWVRIWELKRNKKYMNLDLIEEVANLDSTDWNSYKESIMQLLWIDIDSIKWVDKNKLLLKTYYWLYDIKWDGDERLYEICIVNDMICILFQEISQIPFVQIRCFEDTESNMAVWFIEPILWLQRELNFKKNSASEYINQALNRSWIWSARSWINPKKLISKANNIITTTKSVDEAMSNLRELTASEINPNYFIEQNDFERQIQGLTFTVDTSNPKTDNSLVNTATGARIKFYESNVVIEDVRKHFEQWLVKLAYKLLQDIVENSEDNLTIKKLNDENRWNINKSLIEDAMKKFEINIEAWSSSYDSIENRREEAIAKYNLWLWAKNAWVNVDLDTLLIDVLDSFEWTNGSKYVTKVSPQLNTIWWTWTALKQVEQAPKWPEAITQAVAQGSLT